MQCQYRDDKKRETKPSNLDGSSCSVQVEVHENIMYIPSSTSEGDSNTTRTSAVGACTPNHGRTIAYGRNIMCMCVCACDHNIYVCSLTRGYDYPLIGIVNAHLLTQFSLNNS